jgi:hypothetical protein
MRLESTRGKALCHCEEVGLEGEIFETEHLSGLAKTADHFIGDEQNLIAIAELADLTPPAAPPVAGCASR